MLFQNETCGRRRLRDPEVEKEFFLVRFLFAIMQTCQ